MLNQCPLSGAKQTSLRHSEMSAFDPKRTFALQFCCDAHGPNSGTEDLAPAHDVQVRPCISQGFGCMPCKKRSGLSGPMGISSKLIICDLPKGSFSSIS